MDVAQRIRPGAPAPTGAWRRWLRRDPVAVVAIGILAGITAAAVSAPLLPLANPDTPHFGERLLAPLASGFVLGTDQLGRDVLSRLVWGARVSLVVGAAASLIASTCGSMVGMIAGLAGGKLDNVLMRLIDLMLSFPYVILAIALVAVLGPGLFNAMIAIAVANVSYFARNIRGNVLTLLGQGYVEASRAIGAGTGRLLLRHVLPNLVPPLLVLVSMNIGWMITETAGLSFLGLGAQPPQADWGSMLGDGRQFVTVDPYVTLIPGVAILLLVLALNILGDALRDLLDPRLRGR